MQQKTRTQRDWAKAAFAWALGFFGGLAYLILPVTILARTIDLLNRYPNRDITFDGAFTIGDIGTGLYWVFIEPAHAVLGYIGAEPLAFWHIAIQDPPSWLTYPLAAVCWILIATAVVWGIALALGAMAFTIQTLRRLPEARHDGMVLGDVLVIGIVGAILIFYIFASAR